MLGVRLLLISIVTIGALGAQSGLAQQPDAAPTDAAAPPAGAADTRSPEPAAAIEAAPALPSAEADVTAAPPETAAPTGDQPPASPESAQTEAAAASGSAAPPSDPRAAVHFVENRGQHVTLFERKGDQWLSVCTSPCDFPAPDGPRDYAVPVKAGPTAAYRAAAKGLLLANGDGLQATFKDRSQIRRAGVGVLVAGLVTLAFLAPALDAENRGAAKASVLSTSGVLTLSGIVMLLLKDRMQLSRCVGCNTVR